MAKQVQLRRGTTAQNDAFTGVAGEVTVDTTLNTLRVHDGSQAGGHPIVFPVGTVMLFAQTAAPIGWTKLTTNDNHALRIVTGTASTGGAINFDALFVAAKASVTHVLTTSELAAHSHRQQIDGEDAFQLGTASGSDWGTQTTGQIADAVTENTGPTGSGSGHTHNIAMNVKFVDVIRASKN